MGMGSTSHTRGYTRAIPYLLIHIPRLICTTHSCSYHPQSFVTPTVVHTPHGRSHPLHSPCAHSSPPQAHLMLIRIPMLVRTTHGHSAAVLLLVLPRRHWCCCCCRCCCCHHHVYVRAPSCWSSGSCAPALCSPALLFVVPHHNYL